MAKQQSRSGKQSGREVPQPIHVQKFLGGIDYPADKQTLLKKAKQEGAEPEVMDLLGKLPEREYDSPVSVSREVSKLH